MPKEFSARRLDVRAFAEDAATLSGHDTLAPYERLVAECEGRGAQLPLDWSASGSLRGAGHVQPQVWLHLRAQARLSLTCQRCLQPAEVPVEVDRQFRFVADEATAAAQDDEAEEDVLAISRSFDLLQLVEDEVLMALPLAPMHGTCPAPVVLHAGQDEVPAAPRENPFAVLQKLRQGGD